MRVRLCMWSEWMWRVWDRVDFFRSRAVTPSVQGGDGCFLYSKDARRKPSLPSLPLLICDNDSLWFFLWVGAPLVRWVEK